MCGHVPHFSVFCPECFPERASHAQHHACPTVPYAVSSSPVTIAQVAASIGAGLAKAALAGKDRWQAGRYLASHRGGRRAGHRHRQGRRRSRDHPPLHRPPAGLRGEGAVPRGAGDHRPGDRERLLLRLLLQAPVHARGPRRRSKQRMAELVEARRFRSSAACCRATRRWPTSSRIGEHYKAEIIASIPAGSGRRRCTARAISPTCAAARTCRPPASSRSSS